jgi:hypothetical protein
MSALAGRCIGKAYKFAACVRINLNAPNSAKDFTEVELEAGLAGYETPGSHLHRSQRRSRRQLAAPFHFIRWRGTEGADLICSSHFAHHRCCVLREEISIARERVLESLDKTMLQDVL